MDVVHVTLLCVIFRIGAFWEQRIDVLPKIMFYSHIHFVL